MPNTWDTAKYIVGVQCLWCKNFFFFKAPVFKHSQSFNSGRLCSEQMSPDKLPREVIYIIK